AVVPAADNVNGHERVTAATQLVAYQKRSVDLEIGRDAYVVAAGSPIDGDGVADRTSRENYEPQVTGIADVDDDVLQPVGKEPVFINGDRVIPGGSVDDQVLHIPQRRYVNHVSLAIASRQVWSGIGGTGLCEPHGVTNRDSLHFHPGSRALGR